ncbi:MAG: hypothetical protein LBC06_01375 [Rickettsiales bacterium]|jgi:hypothetical protein|nr:hypothetical protein [Rickettsiales bacterium]
MGWDISSKQSVNSNELEADDQQVKNAIYDTNEYGKKLAEECAGSVLPDQEIQCSQECIGNVGSPAVLGGKKPARYFSNQMHNFDGGALTDQAGLQNSESDYRLGQDSEQQILGSNVITSLYNLLDPLELFREGLSSCDSSRSKDRQTFNSIKPKLPAADYTKESSDQKTLTDNTNERSTETKENVGENVNDGWGSWKVNQETSWLTSEPGENGEVTDTNSDYSGWGLPPDIGSSDGDSEECGPIDDNQTVCTSDSGSGEGSSDSSVDSFLLEENPPLAEIPLTAKEKKLIGEFYEKIEGVYDKNIQSCIAVEALLKTYLSEGIRLNLSYDNKPTVSDLVLKKIEDALAGTIELTSGLRRRDYRMGKCTSKGELDDENNIKAVVSVVRKLFFKGGKVELDMYNNEDGHDRLCGMVWKRMGEFNEEREQTYDELKSAAYEGIVNKDAQVQKNDLIVDVDNCHFYTKYPQDSTIEVAKAVNGLKKAVNDLKKVTNDLKIEELNFKYYIFRIGKSIVRFEEDKDEKRNYTDILEPV